MENTRQAIEEIVQSPCSTLEHEINGLLAFPVQIVGTVAGACLGNNYLGEYGQLIGAVAGFTATPFVYCLGSMIIGNGIKLAKAGIDDLLDHYDGSLKE